MVNIGQGTILDMTVALPPLTEQIEIAKYISIATGKIEALVESAHDAIALLQEPRAALISAAVTGKIDVCGLNSLQTEAA
jgi:type I restriction enzyme S subunit